MDKKKNTFARRIGRGLRPAQKDLITNFLPQIAFTENTDFKKLASAFAKTNLEIGVGNGEFFLHQAQLHPDNLFIGCEPYLNGIATVLRGIKDDNLENTRIFADDIRLLLKFSPSHYFDQVFIICPDPWPKRKQHDRRLLTSDFLQSISHKLKETGKLTIVTDHADYAQWILHALKQCGSFQLPAESLSGYIDLPPQWLYTKYQRKGLDCQHQIFYFQLSRK